MNVKRGQIYFADLNPIVGSEQGGRRPVIVLQNDKGNQYSPTTIVAAITSKLDKPNLPTHVSVDTPGLMKHSIILLEQIRTIDKQRLSDYIGCLNDAAMQRVEDALKASFELCHSDNILNE